MMASASTIGGMHGRLLRVELSGDQAAGWQEPLPPEIFQNVIGGTGLASWLLLRLCPAHADPWGPENPLIFASSPFVGTGITTASKIAVATRSPQTGMIGESLSSSLPGPRPETHRPRRPGHHRHCRNWSTLIVDDDRVRLRPSADLLGLSPAATAERLRAELGTEFRIAAIGQAGEHGVRYAAIANDGRLAGRTGAGAVMGAKRLKAIAVRGSRLPPAANPRRWPASRATWRSAAWDRARPNTAKSAPPPTSASSIEWGSSPPATSRLAALPGPRPFLAKRCCWSTTPASTPAPLAPSAASIAIAPRMAGTGLRFASSTKPSLPWARSAA